MKFVHVKERKSIILDLSEMFDIWCNTSTESRGKSGGWLRYDKKVRLFFFSFFLNISSHVMFLIKKKNESCTKVQ